MTWRYQDVLGNRRQLLATAPSFRVIAEQIAREGRIVCAHPDVYRRDLRYTRAVYCLAVDAELFDVFFNSVNGYRAAYFESPDGGLSANRSLITALTSRLLAYSEPDGVNAAVSLVQPSAKVWLSEVGKDCCQHCAWEWKAPADGSVAEILNDRWERSPKLYATYGRMAPVGTKLRVFGGFVNLNGEETVPEEKRDRHTHIWNWGWS